MPLTSITRDFVVKSGALVEGTAAVFSSTAQTSTLQTLGGAAIAKNLIVGTTSTIYGNETIYGTLTVNQQATFQALTATTSTATTLNVTGQSTFGGNTQFNGSLNTFSGALFVTGTNILAVGTGQATFGGGVQIAGITTVTNNTTASITGPAGALQVTGGVYIGNNLVVASAAYNSATNTANAIYTQGGIYADGGLTVGSNGPVLFKGPVTFSGTATYVLSTNTFFTDSILEMHTPPGGVYTNWNLDDGKDIGFRFHYFTNSTDTNAALVLANDTKYLEWYSSGAESSGTTFTSATYGTFKTGNILLTGTSGAVSTQTGALQVAGGLGVGQGGYFGGIVTATTFVGNFNGSLTGTVTTATNLAGGATGSMPYQSNPGVTTMLPIGTNGYILSVVAGLPSWVLASGLSAGSATTASNIAGGLADQIPYQTAPGNTTFNAGLRFNGTTFTTTNVVVSGTTNSLNNTSTQGALLVSGGAAIAKDLYVGGDINLQGSLYLKGVGLDQITGSTGTFDYVIIEGTGTALTVNDTVDINGTAASISTNTGALQVTGGVGVGAGMFVGGIVTATLFSGPVTQIWTVGTPTNATFYPTFVDANNASQTGESVYTTSSFYLNAATGIVTVANNTAVATTNSGALQVVNGGVGIGGGIVAGGVSTFTNTVGASSTNSGALQVVGGVGIWGGVFVGANSTYTGLLFVNNNTAVATTNSGALQIVNGGVGIGGGIVAGGVTTLTNTTAVSSTSTGALQVRGGVGVWGGMFVGADSTYTGLLFVNNNTAVSTTNSGALQIVNGGLGIGGGIVAGGVTTLTNTTAVSSTSTGALQVRGGVGVWGGMYVGSNSTYTGVLFVDNATAVSTTNSGALQIVNGGVGIGGGIVAGGVTTLTNTTAVSSTNTGALQVRGGVGVWGGMFVGGISTVTNNTAVATTNSGALQVVNGGVGIGGGVVAGGVSTFTNLATVHSTATGALQVAGGLGVGGGGFFGGVVTATTFIGNFSGVVTGAAQNIYTQQQTANASYYPTFVATNAASATSQTVFTTASLSVNPGTGAVSLTGALNVAGIASFTNVTDSNLTTNGAVVISGGIGVAKAATIGTSLTVGGSNSATVYNSIFSNNFLLSSYTSGFITTNALINLDSYSASAYRTCKYVIQIADGTKIHVEEILLFHDGTNVYMSEYAIATSQGELGTFDAVLSGGTVQLNFTANYTPTNMTIKTVRQAITL
jgi:hypothetical protein